MVGKGLLVRVIGSVVRQLVAAGFLDFNALEAFDGRYSTVDGGDFRLNVAHVRFLIG